MLSKTLNIVLLFLLFSSGSFYAQKNIPFNIRKTINSNLKGWTSTFKAFDLSEFQLSDSSFIRPESAKSEIVQLDSFYAIYKPLIRFSPDKRYFVDSYSYQLNLEREGDHFTANPEVDQQVELFDTKTSKNYILFFGGAESWIEEELWSDNITLILAGIRKDESANRHPVIYRVNINSGFIQQYSCSNDTCIQLRSYSSPRLSRMKITGI